MPRKRKSASSPTQTNLLDVAPKLDPAYDADGNILNDGNAYAWNAESEIKSAAGVNYTYDGDGNRLEKSNGKLYWYGAGTEILDESDLSGNVTAEYVFFAGKRIAMRNVSSGNIYYYEEDMLGSSRTMVQEGQTSPCYDADFLPFGYEKAVTTTCTTPYKFEGKERDTETNNDYFGARYYSNHFGRWLSPDWAAAPTPIPYANMTNPQTLNLYAMVSDNPESFADLDGHCGYTPNGSAGWLDISSSGGDICPAMDAQMSATAYMHPYNGGEEASLAMSAYVASIAPQPQQAKENNSTGYSTANEAAKAALEFINPKSIKENREYAGYIYRDKHGRYHYTGPAHGTDQESSPSDARAPKNSTIVGNYHTHGNYSLLGPDGRAVATGDPHRDDFNSDHFSRGAQGDTGEIADMAKTHPGFLGYLGTPSGKFLIYDPATGKERELQ